MRRSQPMSATIYVLLLDEGTEAWRPVLAERLGGEFYRIQSRAPSDEVWQFQTGQTVRCISRRFQGTEEAWVAVEAAPIGGVE